MPGRMTKTLVGSYLSVTSNLLSNPYSKGYSGKLPWCSHFEYHLPLTMSVSLPDGKHDWNHTRTRVSFPKECVELESESVCVLLTRGQRISLTSLSWKRTSRVLYTRMNGWLQEVRSVRTPTDCAHSTDVFKVLTAMNAQPLFSWRVRRYTIFRRGTSQQKDAGAHIAGTAWI